MPRQSSLWRALLAAATVVVFGLAGCGGSDSSNASGQTVDDVLAAVDGLSGKERTAKLVELAQAENGALSLYTSSSIDYMDEVAEAFEDEYDLDVAVYKAGGDVLVQRLVEEHSAGFRGSDVIEAATPDLVSLQNEDIIAKYQSPKTAGLVRGSEGDSWIADKFNTFVVAWNTDRVPKGSEPRSYEDLADPRWKGKLVLDVGDSDWYKALRDHLVSKGDTPDEADALIERIAANATFVDGHTLLTELVAAGEFDLTADAYLHRVKALVKDGAPLAWEPAVEPVISRPDGISIAKDAKRPASAMLFIDFVLDKGQEIYADNEVTPTRRDLSIPPDVDQIAMDVPDYVEHQEEWADRYEQLTRLGKIAPDSG